jgi:hypothetical protein
MKRSNQERRDGTWLVCRRLPEAEGVEDELVIVDDIAEILGS